MPPHSFSCRGARRRAARSALVWALVATALAPAAGHAQTQAMRDQRAAGEARQLIAQGRAAEARGQLEAALADRPNAAVLLAAYADTLASLGESGLASAARFKACAFGAAETCRLLRLDPIPGGEPTSRSTLGGKCMAEGREAFHTDARLAVDRFECAVQAVPESPSAHGALALALVRAGRAREAGPALDRACELGHRPSCARAELLGDLRKKKQTRGIAAAQDRSQPSGTLFLHDGRVVSGHVDQVGGRYVVSSLKGTEEVPLSSVKERYALTPVGQRDRLARPWRAEQWEFGLGLGYAARIERRDFGGGRVENPARHTLLVGASAGYFFSDLLELEGTLRTVADLAPGAQDLHLQLSASPVFHLPMGGAVFALGPMAGVEVGLREGGAGTGLRQSAGPLLGGHAGFKFALGASMGLRTGLSLAYVYAAGRRADDETGSEHRVRALFDVELLWYPGDR